VLQLGVQQHMHAAAMQTRTLQQAFGIQGDMHAKVMQVKAAQDGICTILRDIHSLG
jgi:hypothetical protein